MTHADRHRMFAVITLDKKLTALASAFALMLAVGITPRECCRQLAQTAQGDFTVLTG